MRTGTELDNMSDVVVLLLLSDLSRCSLRVVFRKRFLIGAAHDF